MQTQNQLRKSSEKQNYSPQRNDKIKVLNILNTNSNCDDTHNAMFTVSMTMQTEGHSLNTNNNPFAILPSTKENQEPTLTNTVLKKLISENILEELDPSKENSPTLKENNCMDNNGRNYFEFNSDSENSYNYIHEANKYIIRQSNIVDSMPINMHIDNDIISKENKHNKYNNFNFEEVLPSRDLSILKPGNSTINNLNPLELRANDLEKDEKLYVTTNKIQNFENLNIENQSLPNNSSNSIKEKLVKMKKSFNIKQVMENYVHTNINNNEQKFNALSKTIYLNDEKMNINEIKDKIDYSNIHKMSVLN